MATVRIPFRDARGLIVKLVEADETDPLLGQIAELERERDELRTHLSEAESRRAIESNRLHSEQREAHETGERVEARMLDLLGGVYRESAAWLDEKIRLREERDAEAARANQYERALVQAQNEARLLRLDGLSITAGHGLDSSDLQ